MFATDLSAASLKALSYAISYANRRKRRLVLLHMLSPVPEVEGDRWYTANDVVRMSEEAERAMRGRLLELVSKAKLELEPMCIARVGQPVDGILPGNCMRWELSGIESAQRGNLTPPVLNRLRYHVQRRLAGVDGSRVK